MPTVGLNAEIAPGGAFGVIFTWRPGYFYLGAGESPGNVVVGAKIRVDSCLTNRGIFSKLLKWGLSRNLHKICYIAA